MGIYDREYYRDSTRGSGWFSGQAPATKTIIAINVAIFLLCWLDNSGRLAQWLSLTSGQLFGQFQIWRLVTAAFVHLEGLHLFFNMLFLWIVGREIEAMYGRREYWLLYLTGAVVGNLCYAIGNAAIGNSTTPVIGASGAVWTIVLVYTLYYPGREILLFGVIPMPMWLMAVLYLSLDLLSLVQQMRGEPTDAVAFAAHLGGASYGALFKIFDLRWGRLLSLVRPGRPGFRIVRPDEFDETEIEYPVSSGVSKSVTASSASRPSPTLIQAQAEEFLEARVDEILAKIAREGRSSLTDEEQRILQEASQRARAKRSDRLS